MSVLYHKGESWVDLWVFCSYLLGQRLHLPCSWACRGEPEHELATLLMLYFRSLFHDSFPSWLPIVSHTKLFAHHRLLSRFQSLYSFEHTPSPCCLSGHWVPLQVLGYLARVAKFFSVHLPIPFWDFEFVSDDCQALTIGCLIWFSLYQFVLCITRFLPLDSK